uniref:Uncharacterized protein n=1 Tax=Cacopsylla melanoneura TaxID=428564 RepID=A0A8D9F1W7_9HEMI
MEKRDFFSLSRAGQKKRLRTSTSSLSDNPTITHVEQTSQTTTTVEQTSQTTATVEQTPHDTTTITLEQTSQVTSDTRSDTRTSETIDSIPDYYTTCDNDENSDTSDSENVDDGESSIEKLRNWANTYQISLIALTAVLSILPSIARDYIYLPKDARTLMKTPRALTVKSMDNGEYYHFGLASWLKKILEVIKVNVDILKLHIGIDGGYLCSNQVLGNFGPFFALFPMLKN